MNQSEFEIVSQDYILAHKRWYEALNELGLTPISESSKLLLDKIDLLEKDLEEKRRLFIQGAHTSINS